MIKKKVEDCELKNELYNNRIELIDNLVEGEKLFIDFIKNSIMDERRCYDGFGRGYFYFKR